MRLSMLLYAVLPLSGNWREAFHYVIVRGPACYRYGTPGSELLRSPWLSIPAAFSAFSMASEEHRMTLTKAELTDLVQFMSHTLPLPGALAGLLSRLQGLQSPCALLNRKRA